MKWHRLYLMKDGAVYLEDYVEFPDQVVENPVLFEIEVNAWRAKWGTEDDCRFGTEAVDRPPGKWLKEKAASLKMESKVLLERAERYLDLSEDNAGRRRKTPLTWLAGSVISEQKRKKKDRRKGER